MPRQNKGFVFDNESTADLVGGPEVRTSAGSILETLEKAGYDTSDLASLAEQGAELRKQQGQPEPPPLRRSNWD